MFARGTVYKYLPTKKLSVVEAITDADSETAPEISTPEIVTEGSPESQKIKLHKPTAQKTVMKILPTTIFRRLSLSRADFKLVKCPRIENYLEITAFPKYF